MAINKTRSPFEDMGDAESLAPARASAGAGKSNFLAALLTIIIIVVVIGGVCWGAKEILVGDSIAKVSSKDWQAVFLANGQVYFGKVKGVGMKSVTLTDIYYLQVVTKPLQRTQEGAAGATTATGQTQQELTLIKLGNEIHGPTDAMVINRDQILLTEKLKADSRVVQAISQYVNDQKKK